MFNDDATKHMHNHVLLTEGNTPVVNVVKPTSQTVNQLLDWPCTHKWTSGTLMALA